MIIDLESGAVKILQLDKAEFLLLRSLYQNLEIVLNNKKQMSKSINSLNTWLHTRALGKCSIALLLLLLLLLLGA